MVSGTKLSIFGVCCAALVLGPLSASAQPRHPDYRRALTDLRMARHLLNLPGEYRVVEDQRRATERINRAIHDLEEAAIRDHQNPAWREPSDVPRIRADRFRRARAAVESALGNIQQWEANPHASGWQGRAIRDLNDSLRFIDAAMRDRSWGGPPPRY
jgi:hypothetical protein